MSYKPTAAAATIHRLPVKTRLVCSKCGIDAACDCGVAYVPARERAAAAIAANPEKSDRALAEELGIGKDTLRRARPSGGAHAPTEKRIGKDGKAYPVERQPRKPRDQRRADRFVDTSMSLVQSYCENIAEIEIPAVTSDQTRRSIECLSAGQTALQALKTSIGKMHKPQAADPVAHILNLIRTLTDEQFGELLTALFPPPIKPGKTKKPAASRGAAPLQNGGRAP